MNRSDYVAPQEQSAASAASAAIGRDELDPPSHDAIARLAHALWEERGGGDGQAEEDWLEAERLLQEQRIPNSKGHAA